MTARPAARLLGLYLAVLLACSACAGTPAATPRAIEATTLATLKEAGEARRSILIAAVRSEAAGAITSEQMEAIAKVGRQLDTAILTTGRALEVYLSLVKAGAPASRTDLDNALDEVKRLKAEMEGARP